MSQHAAYERTEFFPPHMANLLRHALETMPSGPALTELAAEICAFPVGDTPLSHPLGTLNLDGTVKTRFGLVPDAAGEAGQ